MQDLFSAYRYRRLSLSLAWKGHARTGFSADIGMRGPRAPGAQWEFPFSSEFLWDKLSKLVWRIELDKVGSLNVECFSMLNRFDPIKHSTLNTQ